MHVEVKKARLEGFQTKTMSDEDTDPPKYRVVEGSEVYETGSNKIATEVPSEYERIGISMDVSELLEASQRPKKLSNLGSSLKNLVGKLGHSPKAGDEVSYLPQGDQDKRRGSNLGKHVSKNGV